MTGADHAGRCRPTVVGLGKIGLPLAVQFASRGCHVRGVDINPTVVDLVNRAQAPSPGEAGLDDLLASVVASGHLVASADTASAVAASDVVVIVVPLVVDADGVPDFTAMDAATAAVAPALQPGALVVYETTLPVWTTRRRFTPMLERGSGLRMGADLFVAFSPERVYAGRIFADLRAYPKLVGGVDPASGTRAREFYEHVLEFDERPELARPNGVWDLGSAEAAELAKLAETTYRDVNIAFANELAEFAEDAGIDVGQVIDASNSQPFSHIHRPGIAVGGHCIPVYPRLLLANAPDAQLPRVARAINDAAPSRCVRRLAAAHGGLRGARVVVLGAAYRGDVKETAFSGVFATVAALATEGAEVTVDDPLYADEELRALGLEPHRAGAPVDAAVVQADHRAYRTLGPADLPGVRTVVDGRHVLDLDEWRTAGVTVLVVGVG